MGKMHDPHYEEEDVWPKYRDEEEHRRVRDVASLIPADARSILDVGCGDGFMLHYLLQRDRRQFTRLVGLDSSPGALKEVNTEKLLGSIDDLPFPARSFDLLLCLEVLEHLPYDTFLQALVELQRVANRYVLVSVPNRENIRARLVRCPQCGCAFCAHRHVRAFDMEKMQGVFSDFKLKRATLTGVRFHYPFMGRAFVLAGRRLGLLESFPRRAHCPQCGYHDRDAPSGPSQNAGGKDRTANLIRRVTGRRIGRWVLALYERNDGTTE